jgi:carbon-monoxide dehydrogenase medium subunit
MGLETVLNLAGDFDVLVPTTVDEALDDLAEVGDGGVVMAGGQSLTVLLTLGLAAPDVVISIRRCQGLDTLRDDGDALHLGAMVTTRAAELSPLVSTRLPLLAAAARQVGSPHVRNFGTVVGNLCHADPGGDLAPVAACLEASLVVRSSAGGREIPVGDLYEGPYANRLTPGEVAVAVRIPVAAGNWLSGYRKVVGRSGDLAVASVAVMLRLVGDRIGEARVVVGGVSPWPVRLSRLEEDLVGRPTATLVTRPLERELLHPLPASLLVDPDDPDDEQYKELLVRRLVPMVLASTVGAT